MKKLKHRCEYCDPNQRKIEAAEEMAKALTAVRVHMSELTLSPSYPIYSQVEAALQKWEQAGKGEE